MESSNFVEWCVDQLLNTKNNYKIIVTTIILYVQKSNKKKKTALSNYWLYPFA